MLEMPAELAFVVGGRNSSNTSHLVELCESRLPTYFIRSAEDIRSESGLVHFDWRARTEHVITDYLPAQRPLNVLVTSGASCPDAMVEGVLRRLAECTGTLENLDRLTAAWTEAV